MHGTRGSRPAVRRYICSTRRYGDPCGEPIVKAEPLEAQLVDWLHAFQPDDELRERVLAAIREATHDADADGTRRRDLTSQLERLQDLYVMGDLTKSQYVMRRQALEDELERIGPPTDPQLDQAAALLADFGRFREIEPSPAKRRKLIASLFERIWEHEGAIVAASRVRRSRSTSRLPRPWSGTATSAVPKAGATGVKPPLDTPDRDPALMSRLRMLRCEPQSAKPR